MEDTAITAAEFAKHDLDNLVVLASPMVNPASEIAICQAFGAVPFQPSESDKLPFQFRVPTAPEKLPPSALIRSSSDGKRGIWLRDEDVLLEMDAWPTEEFRRRPIPKGRDCAVIVVMNRAGGGSMTRKLVVLGGAGGVGTEGAAMAGVDHYRDLEPREKETLVWGAIEVFYRKASNSMTREFLNYQWRYRRGGRCPVVYSSKKPPA